jgi:hypothetical protein
MTTIGSCIRFARHLAEYALTRAGRSTRTETGTLSTEAVVLAAVLVGAAITVGVLFQAKVTQIVQAIPESGFGGGPP